MEVELTILKSLLESVNEPAAKNFLQEFNLVELALLVLGVHGPNHHVCRFFTISNFFSGY